MTSVVLPAVPATSSPLLALTNALGVPRDVLASDQAIQHAWSNLPTLLNRIPAEKRSELLVRMCVAIQAGLFDSAVNYIWNATVMELRQKVREFGLVVVAQLISPPLTKPHSLTLRTLSSSTCACV